MQTTTQLQKRINVEKRIVRKLVRDLLAAGYELAVTYDGAEFNPWSQDFKTVTSNLFACDEEWLLTRKHGASPERSFVCLVYGNDGWDVIADYGLSLEPVLAPINAWTDTLSLND